jgi:hypothetical protein
MFAADARMLEPRADAAAVIRPQPSRCIPSSIARRACDIDVILQHARTA